MAVTALHSAATGLSALSTSLDVIANNLANINTVGFKGSRVNFEDLLYQQKAQPGVENAIGDQRPMGIQVGTGVRVAGTQLSFEQGTPLPTEKELDWMIDGPGLFQVSILDEQGIDGVGYTRAGSFTLNSLGEVVLGNAQGSRLQPPIAIDGNPSRIEVSQTGQVVLFGQNNEELGTQQLELATFVNPAGLKHIGGNIFVETVASGPAIVGEPGQAALGTIKQGFLENSNVDPTRELVDLIKTQRAFEMNSKTIQAADETLQTISNLRRF